MKLLAAVLIVGLAYAQPAFEVASVKLSKAEGTGVRGGCHGIDSKYAPNEVASAPPLGRCVIRDGRLSHMVQIAYRLRSMSMIKGGPEWVWGVERFNVDAKAEDPKATEEQLLQMLQALLIERFDLKFHREIKEMQGYALVVGKNGLKLKEAKDTAVNASFSPTFKPAPGQSNTLTARCYSMARLADLLTVFWNPVADKTGLTGDYDFRLTWNDADGPSVFSAVQEQLGLKLEPQKVPLSYLIIDSAQKPSEN